LRQRDGREQVDRDDPFIDRKVGLDREAALRDAGIVDQAVDAAAPRPGLFDKSGDRVIVGRLERQDHRAGPAIGGDRLERRDIAPGQD
jgi:hypothetical protein